jgi:DNA polymerase-3 subunit chi
MTEVSFYTNVLDQTHLIVKLLYKAHRASRKLHISVRNKQHGEKITRDLYGSEPTSFFGISSSSHDVHDLTSAIISDTLDYAHNDIIINLTTEIPDSFSTFKRVIEIVSQDEENISAARNRYRWYKDRGYSIATHKL